MSLPTLSTDDTDDLLYFCRTGSLTELQETINTLSTQYNTSASAIIQKAIDLDSDGLGSRNSLLHYASANGNIEIVSYFLSQISASGSNNTQENGQSNAGTVAYVNAQNVSGNTALHWSAMNGHVEIVKALVKAGADATVVNGVGRDAVVEAEWSSKEGSDDCANWMLKECGGLETGVGGDINEKEGEEVEEDAENTANGSETNGTGAEEEQIQKTPG